MKDAIAERIKHQVRLLHDPELELRSYFLAPDWYSATVFDVPAGAKPDNESGGRRMKYLVQTLVDGKKDLPLRLGAAQMLIQLRRQYGKPTATANIESAAATVFKDDAEDNHLRSLCLKLLHLDRAYAAADVKAVYLRTDSDEFRFAIEESFLDVSDTLYQSLNPPGGPAASGVSPAPEGGCATASADNVAFVVKFGQRRDFPVDG